MKFKKLLLTVLCFSLFLIIPSISVSAQKGQPIISDKNTTNPSVSTSPFFPSTLPGFLKLHTPSPANLPQQLIIVQTSGNYNQQEATNMIQRISNIDSKTLYALSIQRLHSISHHRKLVSDFRYRHYEPFRILIPSS